MKQDTKDFIKRTAGTSALVASPGILAGTLIAGPLGGLAVGGAVAAGNVLGSLAYKKAKEIREDVENRRRFRELQRSVLAQNGILNYQPMVPAPFVATGDMACGKDMSLSRKQKKEIKTHANERISELAHSEIDRITNSGWSNKHNIGNLNLLLKQDLKDMSCSKDMSCLGKILHKDFTITKVLGDALYRTKVGQVIDKGITLADNLGEGIITRNGKTIRSDFKKITGFSEDSLLAVDEEELKNMKEDIEFTSDPSKKELKKSRYLSMLNEVSRDRLEELLDEGKPKEECVTCNPPVSMFSESPNLQTIAKGVDFGILSWIASGSKHLLKGAKVAGNIAKNSNAIAKATANATKAAEAASKASETGGWLGKIARGIGNTVAKVKEGFTGKVAENVAEGAQKAAEAGAKVAEKATEEAGNIIEAGTKAAENAPKITTKLSQLDVNNMNKYELKGVKMAGNSKIAAALGEKIGYENLGRGTKALESAAATQTAEQIQKNQAKQQQTA